MKPLEADLRRMMAPNTASRLKVRRGGMGGGRHRKKKKRALPLQPSKNLKIFLLPFFFFFLSLSPQESKRNALRDFVDLAGPLGVTHFFILTATTAASYLRVAKAPHGPTLALRISSYALMRDVLASQARPRAPASAWAAPPLVVLQNFPGGGGDVLGEGAGASTAKPPVVGGGSPDAAAALAAELFRSAFPPIDVRTARLASCRRVVLLTYEGGGKLSLRHYSISAAPAAALVCPTCDLIDPRAHQGPSGLAPR